MTETTREWNCCAKCGDDLDTGWECTGCGLDWIAWAIPWWTRVWWWFTWKVKVLRGIE